MHIENFLEIDEKTHKFVGFFTIKVRKRVN